MTEFRTVEHEGKQLLVTSVDMRTADTIVYAAQLDSFKYNKRTGEVLSVKYVRQTVRLVNPKITTGKLMARQAGRMMAPPPAPLPALEVKIPNELADVLEKAGVPVPKNMREMDAACALLASAKEEE